MNADHDADPRFVEFLEWQLETETRRNASLPAPPLRSKRGKGLRMFGFISLMLLCVGAGAAGAYSVVSADDEVQRELQITKAEILVEQARARVDQHVEAFQEIDAAFRKGQISKLEVLQHRQQIAEAEAALRHRELDLEETRITGRTPRNDLSAPKVGDRDFVSARLEAELSAARIMLERVMVVVEQVKLLTEGGFASSIELEREMQNARQAETHIIGIERRLALRQKFLEGEVDAERVELLALSHQAESMLDSARYSLDTSLRIHDRTERLFEGGRVPRSELRQAQARLRAAETEMRLAEIELRIINRKLELLKESDQATKRPSD